MAYVMELNSSLVFNLKNASYVMYCIRKHKLLEFFTTLREQAKLFRTNIKKRQEKNAQSTALCVLSNYY
jgi:hypothetical protein